MSEEKRNRLEKCPPFAAGRSRSATGIWGFCFSTAPDCGVCVSFKSIRYPFRVQADNPVACFNRRYRRRITKGSRREETA